MKKNVLSGIAFVGAVAIASAFTLMPTKQEKHLEDITEVTTEDRKEITKQVAPFCQPVLNGGEELETLLNLKTIPSSTNVSVPVLIYHRISDTEPPSAEVISAARFKEHLQLLQALGYTTVTAEQVRRHMLGELTLPARSVAITFDDGWKDQLIAAGIMNELGISGTFYVISGFFNNPQYFSEKDTIALSENPLFEIGSHSHTHFVKTNIHALNHCMVAEELAISKKILERLLKKPVMSFAWPYGLMTKETIYIASKLGYSSTMMVNSVTDNKPGMSPLDIHRLNIDGRCTMEQLKVMVETGQLVKCQ